MDKERLYSGLGLLIALFILFYSAYKVYFFVPVYQIECRDEFQVYNLTTENVTEYMEVLQICLEYQENLQKLYEQKLILPYSNFSINLSHISVDMKNKTLQE